MTAPRKARWLGQRRPPVDEPASELLRQEREELLAAQRELEASRQQYADLYELAPVGYITFDRAGCIRNINETGARLLASPRTHLLGRPLLPMVKKSDRRAYLNHLTRLRSGDAQATVEVTLYSRAGREMAVQLISLMTEPATQIRTAMVDISERKRAEEELCKVHELLEKRVGERTTELRLANQKLQALFDGSPLAIFTLGRDGNTRSWNKSAERMFGWKEREVLGKPVPHVPEAQREEFEAVREAGLQGKSITVETLRCRKDGTIVEVRLSDAPLRNARGQIVGTMGMLEDISERVRLERALLEISEEEKERLGRDLHDGLGQHLAGISFMAETLKNKLSVNARVEAELAAKIVGHIHQAITVSRDLAKGLFPVDLKTQGFVPGLEKLAASISERFHIRCLVKGKGNIRVINENVARNFYRLAQEAAYNAAKHSHGKTIRISVAQRNGETRLTVEDDGVGIPEESEKSSGMGLRIMEYRARMLGGKLEIRRRRQGGTVVTCAAETKS